MGSSSKVLLAVTVLLLMMPPAFAASSWDVPVPLSGQNQSFGRLGISQYYSNQTLAGTVGRWFFDVTGNSLRLGYCKVSKGQPAFSDRSFMPTFATGEKLPIRAQDSYYTFGGNLQWPHAYDDIPYQWQLFLGTPAKYEDVVENNYTASIPIPAAVWLVSCGILCLVGLKRKA